MKIKNNLFFSNLFFTCISFSLLFSLEVKAMDDHLNEISQETSKTLQHILIKAYPQLSGKPQPQSHKKDKNLKRTLVQSFKDEEEPALTKTLEAHKLSSEKATEVPNEKGIGIEVSTEKVKVTTPGAASLEITTQPPEAPPGVVLNLNVKPLKPALEPQVCKYCHSTYIRDPEEIKKYASVLSLDGGGIRGYMQALWLNYLEKKTNRKTYELFDRIDGTSIGGILALALTFPNVDKTQPFLTTEDMIKLFTEKGDIIFPQRHKYNYLLKFVDGAVNLGLPMYSPSRLEELVQGYFGDNLLGSLLKPVGIVTVDSSTQEPLVLDSTSETMRELKLWHVARATSAAPTYFKSFPLTFGGKTYSCVDGGLYRNNPSTLGVMALFNSAREKMLTPDNIVALSLGTGKVPLENIIPPRAGLATAARPVIDTMMNASSVGAHELMKSTFSSDNYWRINPRLYKNIDLAEATDDNLKAMEEAARGMEEKLDDFIEESSFRHIVDNSRLF